MTCVVGVEEAEEPGGEGGLGKQGLQLRHRHVVRCANPRIRLYGKGRVKNIDLLGDMSPIVDKLNYPLSS